MKRTVTGWVVAGTLALSGAALAQSPSMPTGASARPAAKGGMVEHNGWSVPSDERAFLERGHHMNVQEMELAKLAQQNGTMQGVKDFASMIITEHQKLDDQFMNYARTKKVTLTSAAPKPMNAMEKAAMAAGKAQMDKLKTMKGQAFDQAFMTTMVGQHDAAVGKHMAAMMAFPTGELSQLISQALPRLQQHRQQAYQLLGQLGATAQGVGGSGARMQNGSMGSGHTGAGHPGSGSMGGSTTPAPSKKP